MVAIEELFADQDMVWEIPERLFWLCSPLFCSPLSLSLMRRRLLGQVLPWTLVRSTARPQRMSMVPVYPINDRTSHSSGQQHHCAHDRANLRGDAEEWGRPDSVWGPPVAEVETSLAIPCNLVWLIVRCSHLRHRFMLFPDQEAVNSANDSGSSSYSNVLHRFGGSERSKQFVGLGGSRWFYLPTTKDLWDAVRQPTYPRTAWTEPSIETLRSP